MPNNFDDFTSETAKTIIIKKKVRAHHQAHHGGAWKVAYADFVTAMMALFIVLWLLSSSEKVQKAVGGYFRDPKGVGKMVGSTKAGSGEAFVVKKDDMDELMKRIERAMEKEIRDFEQLKDFVTMTITEEGLRIELMETDGGVFFESAAATPLAQGAEILGMLAAQLGKIPNHIVIEGHTDSRPFGNKETYGNWELSSDRANAARRLMHGHGLRPEQIAQVRGFADQNLRKIDDPMHPSNRRVSIIVKFLPGNEKEQPKSVAEVPQKDKAPAAH